MEWGGKEEKKGNIIASMPRRIQAMVKAKEGKTGNQHKNWFIKCGAL